MLRDTIQHHELRLHPTRLRDREIDTRPITKFRPDPITLAGDNSIRSSI